MYSKNPKLFSRETYNIQHLMARFLVLCLILINALLIKVVEANLPKAPASSPSNNIDVIKQERAEAPQIRKLGKHHRNKATIRSSVAPLSSPSEAPQMTEKMFNLSEVSSSLDQDQSGTNQLLDIHMAKHQHHSIDKSVAGGGVILGGLATAFLLAVLCYIRATRRKNAEPASPVADVAKV